MKKIVIIGIEEISQISKLLLEIKMKDKFEVICFCDWSGQHVNEELMGIRIVSLDNLKNMYLNWEIDAAIVATTHFLYRDLTVAFNSIGLRDVYVMADYIHTIWQEERENLELDNYLWHIDISKPCLRYFEFHVCDQCNLKCKGCGHVSNIAENLFADLDQYRKDLLKLKELFWGCQSIKLLGGEPLLNPELSNFIKVSREIFPEAEVYVATNGLLIPKIENDLFAVMKEQHAYFMVSSYPPTLKMKDEIQTVCQNNNIPVVFTQEISEFNTPLHQTKRFDAKQSYDKCKQETGYCFTLRDGKLSPCIAFYVEELNKKFNAGFEVLEGEDYFVLDRCKDGWQLDQKLHAPLPLCAYCGNRKAFPWEIKPASQVELADYVNLD